MKVFFLLNFLVCGSCGFSLPKIVSNNKPSTTASLKHHNLHAPSTTTNTIGKTFQSIGLGAAILASSFFPVAPSSTPSLPVANAVELSRGAISIQTSTSGGASQKSEMIDSTALFQTVLKNRKELAASFGRVTNVIKEELNSPVFTEITREVLQLEGDITSDIKVSGPSDWTQTFKDLTNGKINFILNGEIVNVAVDTSRSSEEDQLIIKVEGFKGVDLRGVTSPSFSTPLDSVGNIYARRWQERFAVVSDLWNTPLFQVEDKEITAGPVVVGGLTLTIVGAYVGSYAVYINAQQESERAAAEKRQQVEARKAAAAAAKLKKEEEDTA